MAPLYFPKLFPVNSEAMLQNEMTLICAKFGADAVNTSKVTSRETVAPFCLAHPACWEASDCPGERGKVVGA